MRCLLLAVTVTAVAAVRVTDDEQLPPKTYTYLDEPETIRKQLLRGLGCYCKSVSSMKDCPTRSRKSFKSSGSPERERWFHPEVSPESRKPHLCCKFAWTDWDDLKGFAYTQQATAERCFAETRPVEDACCRIGKEEQVAVRLKQFKTRANKELIRLGLSYATSYGKSLPYFSVNDIANATDYNGSVLSVKQVKEFLEHKKHAGALGDYHRQQSGEQVYTCSKPVDELIADQEDCRIRTKDPTECCCLQATVVPSQRCFPAAGASTVGPLLVNGSYAEHKAGGGRLEGNISWPETPEELDKDLPDLLQSKTDPEADDGLEYDWIRASNQWNTTCNANQSVGWVRVENKIKRSRRRMGKFTSTSTQRYKEYHQEWKTECISKEFNRICPKGQGLYVKQFPLGTCTKVPGPTNSDQLQLAGLGTGVVFQCPDGYQSGTKGAMKSDVHCHCDSC